MSYDGQPDFKYHIFDTFSHIDLSFDDRYNLIRTPVQDQEKFEIVYQVEVTNAEEVMEQEAISLGLGYEGGILRDPNSRYKLGRSTLREEIMLKVKKYLDAEGTVVSYEEQLHNANEATINELGHTTRSSHQSNMVKKGVLGALTLRCDLFPGVTFNVGTGFDDNLRRQLWENKESLLGRTVKFKYFSVGLKDRPRFPVFQGFRDVRDMSVE